MAPNLWMGFNYLKAIQSHHEETVYFLTLSPRGPVTYLIGLVKDSALEQPSGMLAANKLITSSNILNKVKFILKSFRYVMVLFPFS